MSNAMFAAEAIECGKFPSKEVDIFSLNPYFFVSLKNKKFSRKYIRGVISLSRYFDNGMLVSLVDEPYDFNVLAIEKGAAIDLCLKKNKLISRERECSIRSCMRAIGGHRAKFEHWSSFRSRTPAWLFEEVSSAYGDACSNFKMDVDDYVSRVFAFNAETPELAAGFFLNEFPVLINAYYGGTHPVVDIYPGKQCDIFWKLENGFYRGCLPMATSLVDQNDGLIYINTEKIFGQNFCPRFDEIAA